MAAPAAHVAAMTAFAAQARIRIAAAALALLAAAGPGPMALAAPAARTAGSPWAATPAPGGAPSASPWGAGPPPATAPLAAEVVVTRRPPGPAMWKIEKGGSQVLILGGLTPLPHMLQWDTVRLEHALQGADALYLPPRATLGAMGLMRLALDRGALELPRGQTLERVLPPAERGRFLATVALVHGKAADYDRWKPAVAGLFLVRDFRKAGGLSDGKPGTTVMHMAEDAHVPVQFVGEVKLDGYVDTAAHLTPQQNLACFDAAMDDIDREASKARAAASAWADGDLKAVGDTYKVSLLDGCLSRIPTVQLLLARGTDEGVATLRTALLKPGKSVAVIDLNLLLRPGGALDRLRADGATVTPPDLTLP